MKTLDTGYLSVVGQKTLDGEDDPDILCSGNSQEAKTGEQGARHPITTPNMRVTDQPSLMKGRKLWSDHLTGLVGWWRRVELEGRRKGTIRLKAAKTVVEEGAGVNLVQKHG